MESREKCAIVDRYVEAFATGDLEIIRDIYAADARVEDPVGTAPHQGIEAVCAFYKGALETGATLALTGAVIGHTPQGSMARAFAEVDGERVASVGRVLYAHIHVPDPDVLRERFRYYGGNP